MRGSILTPVAFVTCLAGCDSTKPKTPAIAMSLSSSAVTVGQGQTSTGIVITLARTNFDKAITLTALGIPTGVTAVFLPSTIPGTSSVGELRISVAGSAPPGPATITVKAAGDGVTEQTKTVDLTVSVTGSFTLGTLEPSVTIAQGGGGIATMLVTRVSSNASDVTLTASGVPAGVTATFGQSPTTSGATSLTLAASAGVVPGAYSLTITGSAAGLQNQTTSVSVNVIAPPATASITMTFCTNDLPVWFAFQNEGFVWQRVTPAGGSFTFSATDKVRVAYVFQTGQESETQILFATRAEIAAAESFTGRDCGTKTLSGSMAGLGTIAGVATMGPAFEVSSTLSPTYLLENIPERALDLLGTRGLVTASPSGGVLTPDRLILRRALSLATSSTIPVLDFSAAESFAPASSNLTVTGMSGETVYMENFLWTTTSTYGFIHSAEGAASTITLFSAPAASLVAGDVHELSIDAYVPPNGNVGRGIVTWYTTPTDLTASLGPALSTPSASTVAAAPYTRVRAQMTAQSDYSAFARFSLLQGVSPNQHFIFMRATAGYSGGMPSTWDMTVPDFSGTAGFNASSWMFTGGSTAFAAHAFSGRFDMWFGTKPAAGEVGKFAYNSPANFTAFRELRATGPRLQGRARQREARQYFSK